MDNGNLKVNSNQIMSGSLLTSFSFLFVLFCLCYVYVEMISRADQPPLDEGFHF